MAKRNFVSPAVRAKRTQLILSKAAAGLSCAQICKELRLKEHIVQYALSKRTSLALVSKANEALEKSNNNPIETALKALVDIIHTNPFPELGIIEEAHIYPKLRKVRLKLSRELELTV